MTGFYTRPWRGRRAKWHGMLGTALLDFAVAYIPPRGVHLSQVLIMYAIDRNVAVIKPKQAFMEWLNALPDNDVQLGLDSLRLDCTVLLIPEFEEPEQAIAYIDDLYAQIFDAELGSWCEDKSLWPPLRTLKTFWEWFDVEIHTRVVDTLDEDTEPTPHEVH